MPHPTQLTRRGVLRGAGVTLSLPWLEAMAATNTSAKPPIRFAALYMPNGVNPHHWTPEGEGKDFKLSQTLSPLAPLREKIVVLKNLWNEGSKGGDGHYVKEAAILTCRTIKKTPGADIANGVSVDQLAAKSIAGQTPLSSLELGVTPVAIGVDAVVGYTRIYGSHIAWSSPTTPLARELNPRPSTSASTAPPQAVAMPPPNKTPSCSTAYKTTPNASAPKSARPTATASTNTSAPCAHSKNALNAPAVHRSRPGSLSVNSTPRPRPPTVLRTTPNTSVSCST